MKHAWAGPLRYRWAGVPALVLFLVALAFRSFPAMLVTGLALVVWSQIRSMCETCGAELRWQDPDNVDPDRPLAWCPDCAGPNEIEGGSDA